ncbi:MAG: hypothetical protein AAGI01_10675 [Myxococcota bacterium]
MNMHGSQDHTPWPEGAEALLREHGFAPTLKGPHLERKAGGRFGIVLTAIVSDNEVRLWASAPRPGAHIALRYQIALGAARSLGELDVALRAHPRGASTGMLSLTDDEIERELERRRRNARETMLPSSATKTLELAHMDDLIRAWSRLVAPSEFERLANAWNLHKMEINVPEPQGERKVFPSGHSPSGAQAYAVFLSVFGGLTCECSEVYVTREPLTEEQARAAALDAADKPVEWLELHDDWRYLCSGKRFGEAYPMAGHW